MELSALPPSWGAPAQPGYPITSFLLIGIKPLMYLITKTDRPGHNFSFLVFFSCRFIYQGPVIFNIYVQRGMSKIREERRRRRSLVSAGSLAM